MLKKARVLSKKLANLKLEYKILLFTICINIVFTGCFLWAGISLVISRYNELLYQSMLSSSALVSGEFSDLLEDLVTMSNIVRTDDTVQSALDGVYSQRSGYGAHYYTDIYSALEKHYQEYKQDYIEYAAIICSRFVSYTYGYTKNHPSPEKLNKLTEIAEEADGAAVWVTENVREEGLFLVREIKKIENLALTNLGTFIIKVDFDKLLSEISGVSKEYEDSYWILYDNDDLIYASSDLTDLDVDKVIEKIKEYGIISINGKLYFAVRGATETNQWNYLQLVSYEKVANSQRTAQYLYFSVLLAGILSSTLLMHFMVRKVMKHFDSLVLRMKEFGSNSDLLPKTDYDYSERMDEIGILHRQFEHMAVEIQTLVVENYKREILMKDAQLKSLESQMNPHFLYNTLETVNWRAKAMGEVQISQIVEALGHFLRMTLNKRDSFSLKEELNIIRYYMTIQQMRFDNRLNFTCSVPEQYQNARIPKLSIQPLVENAVHYALEQIMDDCYISLSCVKEDTLLQIYVKNTGSEFPEDLLEKLRSHEIKEKGLGIALLNIVDRIKLMFGERYGLIFYNEEDCAVVKMEIPYITGAGEEQTDA